MAERMVPIYERAEATANAPLSGLSDDGVKAKVAGAALMSDWRPWLFPQDDDG